MSGGGAEIIGLREWIRELRKLDDALARELRVGLKKVANEGRDDARAEARGMGGIFAAMSGAISARASGDEAAITVNSGSRYPAANVAFWGTHPLTRLGWFAATRFEGGDQGLPDWVGNTWDVAEHGQGPHAINEALASNLPRYMHMFEDVIQDIVSKAYPGGD